MNESSESRRRFLKAAGLSAGAVFLSSGTVVAESGLSTQGNDSPAASESGPPDYTLHIKTSPIEIAPNRIISATTYNGQFPGPLLRFKEGQQVTVVVYNDTDTPEQLHWHGQMVPPDVDGASEEGTPFIPAYGKRRIAFTPRRSREPMRTSQNQVKIRSDSTDLGTILRAVLPSCRHYLSPKSRDRKSTRLNSSH